MGMRNLFVIINSVNDVISIGTVADIPEKSVDLIFSFVRITKNLNEWVYLCVADLCLKSLEGIAKPSRLYQKFERVM